MNSFDRPSSKKNLLCFCGLHLERVTQMPDNTGIDIYTCRFCDRMWTRFNFKHIPVWREVLVNWFWNIVYALVVGEFLYFALTP
jgi:hypothetical protein